MTKSEVGTMAVRILAIYCWVESIGYLASLASFSLASVNSPEHLQWHLGAALFNTIPGICFLLAGSVLWRYAEAIGGRMVPSLGDGAEGNSASGTDWQTAAFATVGLFLLVAGIPEAVTAAAQLLPITQLNLFNGN